MDKYIDSYIEKVIEKIDDSEKKRREKDIALHLKKDILPIDSHIETGKYERVITEIKEQIEKRTEIDFKDIFNDVCKKYILRGEIITAELPHILTRIILNMDKFLLLLIDTSNIPFTRDELTIAFASRDKKRIQEQLKKMRNARLTGGDVVFSTFDEASKDKDPVLNLKIIDIINKLALDEDVFEGKGKPYTAVKIRYRNSEAFDKKYPTFMDAGWDAKFFPSEKNDNYGRTRNLVTGKPDMPEVVHKNMPFSRITIDEIDILEDN